jgi:hypothetical protein
MGLLWRFQPEVDARLIHRTIGTPAASRLPAFSYLDGVKPEYGAAVDQRTTSPRCIVFDLGRTVVAVGDQATLTRTDEVLGIRKAEQGDVPGVRR